MPLPGTPDELMALLHETVAALVRRDGPDLTTRQLGVFLRVYVYAAPHTGHDLALALNLPDGAVSDALDQLCGAVLVRREANALDARSVLVQRTVKGAALIREIRQIMREAISLPPAG
ncbi:MarR family transcriptional regulator [Roseomonas nepalensis]|uniref:MarR family transcriptional regulator n=1 Tax=Muricoccus nepalensis TaxID=1854500 RepID=A0A502GFU0_9PROT|nr:MarR family transcriptional regulator [Roseomonas nepalensis]TPG61177.1 MarR family transcriptional regulator [Roseomonas nepalensis]